MAIPLSLLRALTRDPPADVWSALLQHAWDICVAPLATPRAAEQEVPRRDRRLGDLDLFLATAGWDLWAHYLSCVPRTALQLGRWWLAHPPGRAVLILDSLSLRELPWLLHGAEARGYTLHQARPTGAELPSDTTAFARALGLSHRGMLQNNGASRNHSLAGAVTDSHDLPFDAIEVGPHPDVVLWHHWPDVRLHELAEPGHGASAIADEAGRQLSSEAFWALVHRLTRGRRLIITSDHGYAASGLFSDVSDASLAQDLKDRFKSGRWVSLERRWQAPPGRRWMPPIDLVLDTPSNGECAFVVGRRKWKIAGGYPTLTHGGLTLLELAVPFLELTRPSGS